MGNLIKVFEILSLILSSAIIVSGIIGTIAIKEKDGKIFFGIVSVIGAILFITMLL